MNVNLQRFTRTWPSATAGTTEGEEGGGGRGRRSTIIITIMIITPHAQRERGKVIALGVMVYIYMFVKKNI